MEWSAEGLIIGVRRHGESSVVLETMVRGRGRCHGLVRGGRSPKQAVFLQLGNSAQLTWRARIEDHLGTFSAETTKLRAADLIANRQLLFLAQMLAEHLHVLPERDAHDALLDYVLDLLDRPRTQAELAKALVEFEMFLLDELGFGLDLSSCAVTGVFENLTHMSPKTGRVVCEEVAEPYKERLFRLPKFLHEDAEVRAGDIVAGFAITGHFLDRHIWMPRGINPPATRDWLIQHLAQA